MAESVLVDGNRVICTPGGPKDNVVALDRFTGKTIWSSRGNGEQASYCSPQLFRQGTTRLIVTMTAKSIIGIDADTGEFYWRYPHTQRHDIHANTPVFSDGMVFCAGERKTGSIMLKLSKNGKQAKLAWHKPEFTNLMGGIVHLNGYIYGSIYRDRDWQCLNWETGEKQYSYTQLDEGIIIYADQRFYCYARDGQFALVNANSNAFEIKSSFQITLGNHQHWSHPVIHAQRLYIRHGDVLMVYSIARN